MNDESEDELMARVASGDASAARALTLRLAPRIFAHAVRLLGDRAEAEDATQDALMKLWRIAPDWEPGRAQVGTWLYRVTANLCIDRIRRRRSADLEDAPEIADEAPPVGERMTDAQRVAALEAALATLPARQRQAVVLKHLDDMPTGEVARIMDIGPRAAESLIARGRKALTARLAGRRKELGYEDD
ncbi:RNA polymerase sigma-70 factor, ECF subfamily [Roseivivax halotolerans]|uniref:RNA polymerase sigma-70 factor, ECF subfamily n=2 Tax=Roseivivax halotolerans TaxID=93684 RepID=A0A1I6ABR5_9RHOB|nr:RNA polymerase sigma-70 factor, ECF subfamily [Roseivivax halotolerans]